MSYTKMDPEQKAKWLEALRSGRYKQGRGALSGIGGFCCLGVFCDVVDSAGWRPAVLGAMAWTTGSGYLTTPSTTFIPRELAYPGLGALVQSRLAEMNDNGASFEEIANWIEKNL